MTFLSIEFRRLDLHYVHWVWYFTAVSTHHVGLSCCLQVTDLVEHLIVHLTGLCLWFIRSTLLSERNFININFVVALILALIFFLAGIDQSSNRV